MPKLRLPNFRFRLIVAEEYQPVESIPLKSKFTIFIPLIIAASMQIFLSLKLPPKTAEAINLKPPPSNLTMNILAMGDPVAFGKVTTLWLQAFDNQKGQSISFKELDYNNVTKWLRSILQLDERAQYPLFSAARIYAAVLGDKEKIRIMLEFIREQFLLDPKTRWEWMAAATTLAKNDLKDIDLALEYAQLLNSKTKDFTHVVPSWARQMEPFLLSDNNKFEDAAEMLLQLLESDEVTDPQEFIFLYDRLERIFIELIESGEIKDEQRYLQMEKTFQNLRERYIELQGVDL